MRSFFGLYATSAAMAFGAVLVTACGGNVLVDEAGTTSSTSTSSTGTGFASCDSLQAAMKTAFAAASQCNACFDSPQCTGPTIEDRCGCSIGTNGSETATAASVALAQWAAAGCDEPIPCPPCLQDSPVACVPSSGTCAGTCSHVGIK